MIANASSRNGLIVVLLAVGLAGCGNAKPFEYRQEADEMKPGSGLFSGNKGKFVIFESSGTKPEEPEPEDKTPPAR